MTHRRPTLVVVGHGLVGHRFVQAAIERGLDAIHDLVVLGAEPPSIRRPPADPGEPVVLSTTIPVGTPVQTAAVR